MKKSLLIFFMIILAASAYGRKGERAQNRMKSPEKILMFADELNLSEEQVQSIEDIIYHSKKEAISLEADIKEIKLDMQRLMKNRESDFSLLEAKVKEKFRVKEKLALIKLKTKFAIRKVLTPEQEKSLRTKMQQHKKIMMFERKGKGKRAQGTDFTTERFRD